MSNMYQKALKHNIPAHEAYTYDMLLKDISEFKARHAELPVFSIGKSREGRELFAVKFGKGSRRIFICGAHHGMEWLTAKICIQFAFDLADGKYDVSSEAISLYLVPMVNPDGVQLASNGIKWQANAIGTDLNHNYDALWELSKQAEKNHGILSPCSSKYGGPFPESEPESQAIANFTRQNKFDMAVALHSQGEVIYYDFCGIVPRGSEEYLRKFESVSRYKRELPQGTALYGGYKDWFIKKFRKPAFTIEVGLGENPLPLSQFNDVYSGVLPILLEILKS